MARWTRYVCAEFMRRLVLMARERKGYNTLGVYANDVVCTISEEKVKGSYLLVLFENFCDPIVTGREELGFP
jgi:acetoacetate decarboxylase